MKLVLYGKSKVVLKIEAMLAASLRVTPTGAIGARYPQHIVVTRSPGQMACIQKRRRAIAPRRFWTSVVPLVPLEPIACGSATSTDY